MENTSKINVMDLKIGQSFLSDKTEMKKENMIEFAKEFDPQPFHVDEEAGKDSFFRTLAASGWHSAGVTMNLMINSFPIEHGIVGSNIELKWTKPVVPGDILQVKTTVTDIYQSTSKPNNVFLTLKTETFNQDKEVCQILVSHVLAFKEKP